MRRSVVLSLTVMFAASAVAAAPVSFALDGEGNDSDGYAESYDEYENDDQQQQQYVEKDTSWFDYYDQQDTYEISTEADLLGLASLVNEQQVDKWKPTRLENFEGITFVLTRDIKLTSSDWSPIGTGGASYFAGIFDGNGHTISGLEIDIESGSAGLFGYLVGTVKDLTVEGNISSGDGNCGGIAGILADTGQITGCSANVSVSGRDKVGGIAGYNDGGLIESCMNYGSISGAYKVGGIVGENWGGIVNMCGNRGDIESTRRGVGTYGTGGIAGRSVSSDSRVTESFNSGKISSNTEATGGVVGYVNASGATVSECYNTGEITVKGRNGNKNISESYAGGVIGTVGAVGVVVENCYNSATVTGADISGGVIGYYINESGDNSEDKYMSHNYYPGGTFSSGIGALYNKDDRQAEDATTGISARSFSNISSSLSTVYKNDDGIYGNNGYPVLVWQEAVDESEKVYMEEIPEDVQRELDAYLAENAETSLYGHSIVRLFSLSSYINDALITYNEEMKKAEKATK